MSGFCEVDRFQPGTCGLCYKSFNPRETKAIDYTDCIGGYGQCCGDMEYGPDPFAEEIRGDSTPVWECSYHRFESAMDI